MKDKLENRFNELQGQFDIAEPEMGHFDRFKARLEEPTEKKVYSLRKMIATLSIAASLLLFGGVWIGYLISDKGVELASVSSEMKETQNYFLTTIQKELQTIELERNDDTKQLIDDAILQLERLEDQYINLTIALKENSDDQRIIHAMINNFQDRIVILQDVLSQIEDIKNTKAQNNETYV